MACASNFKLYHPVATCEWCGKGSYTSRTAARSASRRHHLGQPLNAYRCPVTEGIWHYGTLPSGGRGQARRSQNEKVRKWHVGTTNGANI
ncbi:hypothetical protein KIPE111705_07210 [Kibdelosporangium persicum]